MKQTKNYNLNIPEQTDFINVDDFNENFNIIDDKLKTASEEAISSLGLQEVHGISYIVTLKMSDGSFKIAAKPYKMTEEKWKAVDWDTVVKDSGFVGLISSSQGQEFKYIMDNEEIFKKLVEQPKSIREVIRYPKATEYMVSEYSRLAALYTSSHLNYVRGEDAEGHLLPIGASEDGDGCKAFNGEWSNVNTEMGSWIQKNLENPIATKVTTTGEKMIYYYNLEGND